MPTTSHDNPVSRSYAWQTSRCLKQKGIFQRMLAILRAWRSQPSMSDAWRTDRRQTLELAMGDQARCEVAPRITSPDLPAEFKADQARTILAIRELNAYDRLRAAQVLDSLTPYGFSHTQVQCIRDMLLLNDEDFVATLADASEPCELRDQLRAQTR